MENISILKGNVVISQDWNEHTNTPCVELHEDTDGYGSRLIGMVFSGTLSYSKMWRNWEVLDKENNLLAVF
jgi:hypothetical protein